MRVFVTGASGWIGSAAVDELLSAGHEVTGLARSDASAAALEAKGVRVRRGDLDDLASLRAGAEAAEAVIHLANKHDWSNPAASNAAERAAVQTIGDVLVGSDRRFLLASGVAALAQDRAATEDDASPFHGPESPRGGSENLALEFVDRGVQTVSLRFAPTVHGTGDHGFIAAIAAIARRKGVSGYPGDGATNGPRSTAPMPDALLRLGSRMLRRARGCMPSPKTAFRLATSPQRSAARSTCPSPRSSLPMSKTTSGG
jgi:nucleoside-diphosphate-sugar epimerase